ncbi:MAG: hypothetical protein LUE12_07480 [Ruminococcus sp.]|nr:hypothetical protein [Ruminococcus sp.]
MEIFKKAVDFFTAFNFGKQGENMLQIFEKGVDKRDGMGYNNNRNRETCYAGT